MSFIVDLTRIEGSNLLGAEWRNLTKRRKRPFPQLVGKRSRARGHSSRALLPFSGDGRDWKGEWPLISPGWLLAQGARAHH